MLDAPQNTKTPNKNNSNAATGITDSNNEGRAVVVGGKKFCFNALKLYLTYMNHKNRLSRDIVA